MTPTPLGDISNPDAAMVAHSSGTVDPRSWHQISGFKSMCYNLFADASLGKLDDRAYVLPPDAF
jgi:hypothetical protein